MNRLRALSRPVRRLAALGLLALGSVAALPALAQVKIGVTVSTTGPAVSLGIPEKNTIALLPKTIAGQIGAVHRARRRQRLERRGRQHAPADPGGQGRRDHRLDDDAEHAGDDRRDRRKRHADDLAGIVGTHHRADEPEEGVDVQDAADRHDDGAGDPRARRRPRPAARWPTSASTMRSARPSMPSSRSSPRRARSASSTTSAMRRATPASPHRC